MGRDFLAILIAFLGYSLHNIAQATQKIGLDVMPRRRARGWAIWITGTVVTPASPLLILYAVSIGNVALVGAMAGSGLASLAVFSMLVMKEKVRRRELIGVCVILAGVVVVGVFSRHNRPSNILLGPLFLYLGVAVLLSAAALLASLRRKRVGIAIGLLAGVLGGFVPLFQKVSTSRIGRSSSLVDRFPHSFLARALAMTQEHPLLRRAAQAFTNPYALAWIALSLLSFGLLQFAYRRDKAIRIIPAFSATTVVVPVTGGVLFFGATIHPVEWPAVAGILAGVFLLTLKPRSSTPG
jgi:drug/metabolite transporter (DMT)-like permease